MVIWFGETKTIDVGVTEVTVERGAVVGGDVADALRRECPHMVRACRDDGALERECHDEG